MKTAIPDARIFALRIGVALAALALAASSARALDVNASQNTKRLMPYQVLELTFQHDGKYENPAWDVAIDVTFTAPSGRACTVGGFFYGSSTPQAPIVHEPAGGGKATAVRLCEPADLWKARFAPDELGKWTFTWSFANPQGERAAGQGSFEVVKGRVHQKGFVRIDPTNRYRFVFDDGSPYFPVGFQDGIHDGNNNGSAMDQFSMEGPWRLDDAGKRPKPPEGPLFARGPSMNPVNGDVYFGRHARAGFNLWRFSPNNFSINVFAAADNAANPTLDNVRWEQARMVDEMLQMTRKYGIRNFYGFFGYTNAFNEHPDDAEGMAKAKRALKYSVDRWGAYVDIWEFLNEQKGDDRWYGAMIRYLKSIDPYHHPISTSWERPDLDGIDINAPHWYDDEEELVSDHVTAERIDGDKKQGKPVIYGEQGNNRGREDRTAEGIGGVWDPGSARRMRVRAWTALFEEAAFVFWETSYAKDGHYMNIWIGPEERQYIRALADFASRLDCGVRIAPVHVRTHEGAGVRAYALASRDSTAVYLYHFDCLRCRQLRAAGRIARHTWDHDRGEARGVEVTLDIPAAGRGYWYDPSDASIVRSFEVKRGEQTVKAPAFAADLALLVTSGPPPDSDGDGTSNDIDEDDDDDGVPDASDAWPLEREEWSDADGDRIGDNMDADVDSDGVADDLNGNGVPDNEEPDWDGDGAVRASAVPWDAFPRDPREWRDTDGDGVGDNADTDDDGDGFSDNGERAAGTNDLDPVSFPTEPTKEKAPEH